MSDIPSDLHYTAEHEWVRRSAEDRVRFGITDFAQSARGSGMDRFFEKGLPVLGVMDVIASETGASHAAIALAWINAQPGIAAPIASARVPEQLDALIEGATLKLSDDQLARLTDAG